MYVKKRNGYYKFICECGQTTVLRVDTTAKHCRQQGCVVTPMTRHGRSHTRLYKIWSGMRDRCINSHRSAITYKKRGIGITPDWDLFLVFEEWALNNGYTDTLTIDRIDIDKGYSPDNCEWVTRAENTKRQCADGHGSGIPVLLTEVATRKVYKFISINKAGEFLTRIKTAKPRTRATLLEKRLKTKSIAPYLGYTVTRAVEEEI